RSIGRVVELPLLRCFGEPAGDAWNVCPHGVITGCAVRATDLFDQGEDLHRAAGRAAYACEWGDPSACGLRSRIDLARGVPAGTVLFDAVARCDANGENCAAAEELLRATAAENLRDATDAERGFIGQFGCR